jgi:indole-3-glycerol phosphate synthase
VDEYQIFEARAYGADAILLIVAAASAERLRELLGVVRRIGMEALVEVRDEEEMEVAVGAGAGVVGVNHRDLRTFEVDLGLSGRLRPLLGADAVFVAESGVHSAEDARQLRGVGVDAILVGEALMRAPDPAAKLRELAV